MQFSLCEQKHTVGLLRTFQLWHLGSAECTWKAKSWIIWERAGHGRIVCDYFALQYVLCQLTRKWVQAYLQQELEKLQERTVANPRAPGESVGHTGNSSAYAKYMPVARASQLWANLLANTGLIILTCSQSKEALRTELSTQLQMYATLLVADSESAAHWDDLCFCQLLFTSFMWTLLLTWEMRQLSNWLLGVWIHWSIVSHPPECMYMSRCWKHAY